MTICKQVFGLNAFFIAISQVYSIFEIHRSEAVNPEN